MDAFARIVVACSLALTACGPAALSNGDGDGGTGDGGNGGPHTLSAIEISPLNPIVELDLNEPGSQGFTVIGHYLDGVDEDLTAQATLSVDNPVVGAFNTGTTLDIPARAATQVDVSKIHAEISGAAVAEAQITVVSYRRTGATTDFFFVLPFNDSAGQAMKPLEFGTAVPALDVFFLMDTTGSMGGAIAALKNSLSNTVAPQIQTVVPNTYFGLAQYRDFPGYGASSDLPIYFVQAVTSSVAAVQAGIANLGAAGGGDTPESGIEAIYQVITGAGLTGPSPLSVPATNVQFRAAAMPVIVSISDAVYHAPGENNALCGTQYNAPVANFAHTRQQTKDALAGKCSRNVGISTSTVTCSAQADMEDFATSTGARVPPAAWDVGTRPANCAANQCCTGSGGAGRLPDAQGLCPLVFLASSDGTGLGSGVVTGITMLARFAQFDVLANSGGPGTDIAGHALPSGHTTADFIKAVVPTAFTLPAAPPIVPSPTFDATTFHGVTPNTKVKFNVNAFNDFVPQTAEAQIFKASITVTAGGCTPLDSRDVLILVPPVAVSIARVAN